MAFRSDSIICGVLVVMSVAWGSCADDKNDAANPRITNDASAGDTNDAAVAGTVTLLLNHSAPIWIRVDGNICPAVTVATKAGSSVQTEPLPTTCCTCGRAAQLAVYRKIAVGSVFPLKWDGREFFTVNTGDNCIPLRNETRAISPGDYVGTLHFSLAAPVGSGCENTANGDVACYDMCEPTQTTQVPFTVRAAVDTIVEVNVPPV